MRRFTYKLITSLFLLLFIILFLELHPVSAAYLYFSPSSKTATQGEVVSVDLWIDTGGLPTISADVYIPYNKNLFVMQSIASGSIYPYQTVNVSDTLISIRSLVTDAGQSVTGIGKLATLTFTARSTGNTTLTIFCDLNASDTSQIRRNDSTATNIINCSQNIPLALTIMQMVTPTPQICPLKNQGDADCNGIVDLVDFEMWRKEFTQTSLTKNADFNADGMSNIVDFEIWRKNIYK